MDEIARLCRPEIYRMQPYSSARTEGSQDASVFLDANENPYPPYPGDSSVAGLNRYPEPQPAVLIDRFAELFDVPRESVFLSRGADEAIDLLTRAFCAAGRDGVMVTPPTFVMYETSAAIQGAAVHEVPLLRGGTFHLDVDTMLEAQSADPGVKLVFVCSPNNPTGNLLRRADILRLASSLCGRALVVVDQLYVEYSGEPPLSTELADHPNLVVLRSLSKEYSLAGERLGITVAHPEVVGILRRVMAPYSLTASSIRTVTAATTPDGIAYARANIDRLVAERGRVAGALAKTPSVVRVHPSDANFLLVEVDNPGAMTATLAEAGIKVRNRDCAVPGTVRVTIGTKDQNDALLQALL